MFPEDSLSGPSAPNLQRILLGVVREKAGLRLSESRASEVVSVSVQCHSSSCGILVRRTAKGSDSKSYYSTILRDAPDAAWRSEFRGALDQLFD